MIENTFKEYNEEQQRQAKFKHDVAYSHIVANPGLTTAALAKLMYCNHQTIDHYIKHIEHALNIEKGVLNGKVCRFYFADNPKTYEWGSVYKKTDDPLRKYFEWKFKDLPAHLKEPIFTGKIDASIVRSFNEGDLDHCYVQPKRKDVKVHIGCTMDLI